MNTNTDTLNAAATYAASLTTKRQAIAAVRAEADSLIEQAERRSKGWDKGAYRSDDTMRQQTIGERRAFSVAVAYALSRKFAAARFPGAWTARNEQSFGFEVTRAMGGGASQWLKDSTGNELVFDTLQEALDAAQCAQHDADTAAQAAANDL